MAYPQRVSENIIPLSVANCLPDAFREWACTEHVIDHKEPIETCQLCDKEQLRYHFEIRNSRNDNLLMVGSKCILRFRIPVLEHGRELAARDAKRKLDRLIRETRIRACMKALRDLAAAESNDILHGALDYYDRKGCLTPKQAFVVFWRLRVHRIDHSPSFFKINLRKERYREDLGAMDTDRVRTFWIALKPSQRELALRFGHTPPPPHDAAPETQH